MTNDEEIVDRILDDMAEIGDWDSIVDALGANGINSHYATEPDVLRILHAVFMGSRVYVGVIASHAGGAPLARLPDAETPAAVTRRIFAPSGLQDRISEMMRVFIAKT